MQDNILQVYSNSKVLHTKKDLMENPAKKPLNSLIQLNVSHPFPL